MAVKPSSISDGKLRRVDIAGDRAGGANVNPLFSSHVAHDLTHNHNDLRGNCSRNVGVRANREGVIWQGHAAFHLPFDDARAERLAAIVGYPHGLYLHHAGLGIDLYLSDVRREAIRR